MRHSVYYVDDRLLSTQHTPFRERIMKVPIIAATILAYAILAAAWICYSELALP